MAFKVPNEFRITEGPMGSDNSIGNVGAFKIPWHKGGGSCVLFVIASDGKPNICHGWEHVSVSGCTNRGPFIPSWDQMCYVKDLFWDEQDCVLQFHPPKADYINNNKNTLHMWRKFGSEIELPPKELV